MANNYVDESFLDLLEQELADLLEEAERNENCRSDNAVHEQPEAPDHEIHPNSSLQSDRNFSPSSFSRETRIAPCPETQSSSRGFDISTSASLAGAQQSNPEVNEDNPTNFFLAPVETARGDFCQRVDTQSNPSEHSSFQNNIGRSNWVQVPQNSNCRKRENNPAEFFPRKKLAHSDSERPPQISIGRGRNEATAPTEEENRKFSSSYALCSQSDYLSNIEMTTESASLGSVEGAEAVSVGGPSGLQTRPRQAVKKTFKCDVCSKTFGRKSHLDDHSRTHTGDKSFVCSTCGRRFPAQSNLTRHLRAHTGEKTFECVECGKRFAHKGDLTKHLLAHTGEKNFKCDECSKRFARKHHLTRHLRTHTGEKNFACEECGKRFAQKQNLTRHLRTHTGEKNFACEECGRKFARKDHLTTHLQTHTEEKPFQCEFCGKKYADKHCRDNHERDRHGEKEQ